jgi:hypothetical protein
MWIITHDFLSDGKCVGVCSRDYVVENHASLTERFRLRDGDGEAYFEGISDDAETEAAFAPLDDFGEGYAGCAAIDYWVRGVWRPT